MQEKITNYADTGEHNYYVEDWADYTAKITHYATILEQITRKNQSITWEKAANYVEV